MCAPAGDVDDTEKKPVLNMDRLLYFRNFGILQQEKCHQYQADDYQNRRPFKKCDEMIIAAPLLTAGGVVGHFFSVHQRLPTLVKSCHDGTHSAFMAQAFECLFLTD